MVERQLPPLDDLEAALVDLGQHIDHPHGVEVAPTVTARLTVVDHRSARPRWVPVGIAAAVLLVALLALPAPREALADWLGIGAVRVVRTDQPSEPLGSELRLGRAVSLEEARDRAPFTIVGPPSLGPPSAVYGGEPSIDAVTLLWAPAPGLPATESGVGALLTAVPGSTDRALVEKQLGPESALRVISVGDSPAFWIAGGQHELRYLDPEGRTRRDTTRLAANTLLWERDGVTFRLESRLDREAAVELAHDLQPVG